MSTYLPFPDPSSESLVPDDLESRDGKAPGWALTLSAMCALFISILGFFVNLLTILALPHTRKLRKADTWFVVNLAVIELMFCVTVLPMSAAHLLVLRYTNDRLLDVNACRLFVFLRYVMSQAELLSIAAIAINRCILIAFPKKYPSVFTKKKTVMFIVGIWIVSTIILIFPLLEIYGEFDYNEKTEECDFADDSTSRKSRKLFLCIGFLIPCAIIVLSYSYIFYKARQSSKRVQKKQKARGNVSPAGETVRPATGLSNRDMRIARTIAVIFIVFLACCGPVSIAHFKGSSGQIPTTLLLLHPLYWLQYCLNPFIYVFMNKQYRDAYISYIAQWWPKIRQVHIGTPDEETSISSSVKRAVKKTSVSSKPLEMNQGSTLNISQVPSIPRAPTPYVHKKHVVKQPSGVVVGGKYPSLEELDNDKELGEVTNPRHSTSLQVILHNPDN